MFVVTQIFLVQADQRFNFQGSLFILLHRLEDSELCKNVCGDIKFVGNSDHMKTH